MITDPGGLYDQSAHDGLIQAARRSIIDILDAGCSSQFGRFQPSGQRLVLAPAPLLIHQQGESFQAFIKRIGKAECKRMLEDLMEVPPHAVDA